jgi:hypothetical protein
MGKMRELRHSRALDAPVWPQGGAPRSSLCAGPVQALATASAELAEAVSPIASAPFRLRRLDHGDTASCRRLNAGHAVFQTARSTDALAWIARLKVARSERSLFGLAAAMNPNDQLVGWILFRIAEDKAAELHFCFDGRVDPETVGRVLRDATPSAVRFLEAESLSASVSPGDPVAEGLVSRLGLKPQRGGAGAAPLRFQRDLALIL